MCSLSDVAIAKYLLRRPSTRGCGHWSGLPVSPPEPQGVRQRLWPRSGCWADTQPKRLCQRLRYCTAVRRQLGVACAAPLCCHQVDMASHGHAASGLGHALGSSLSLILPAQHHSICSVVQLPLAHPLHQGSITCPASLPQTEALGSGLCSVLPAQHPAKASMSKILPPDWTGAEG